MVRGSKRKNPGTRQSSAASSKRGSAMLTDVTDASDGEGDVIVIDEEPATPGKGKTQTVIEFLENERDEAIKKIQENGAKAIEQFRAEAAQAKERLLASLNETREELVQDEEPIPSEPPQASRVPSSSVDDKEPITQPPSPPQAAQTSRRKAPVPAVIADVPPRRSYGEQKTIYIACTSGVYKGQKFTLILSSDANRLCHIGRSSGKKYKAPHGLSLPKDPEISTTHAEIRWSEKDDNIYITDQNSTNGTKINGRNLKPRIAVRLDFSKPIRATLGSSDLTLTL
ncbi:Aste57867_10074 [Aphanomyces stellatus]|uniref:Aste57867_10074 protein n=1 Tax=Aphanomyces stellatus TaxID=120398 RepID=A0A485KPW2_9STRA|nr:hypothetical protein As57867_010035 [Aphanomyces stellatus]VFT86950.1 Aste57867_10074 [Aphanomyces stellatus]